MTDHFTFDRDQALSLLHEKDAQIAGLLARVEAMRGALREVMQWHSDPNSSEYRDCDNNECAWCEDARKLLADSPPPALVPLEEVKRLLEALEEIGLCSKDAGARNICKAALEAWRTKHP